MKLKITKKVWHSKKDGKRVMKIGKLLKDNPELQRKFNNDPKRETSTKKDLTVCISRHPYDVAGMSTDRGWTSCMDLNKYGSQRTYVLQDVKHGTLVAYLINDDDRNLKNPIGCIAIKPFVSQDDPDDVILYPEDKVYGSSAPGFAKLVKDWCNENGSESDSVYCKSSDLYNDTGRRVLNQAPLYDENNVVNMDVVEEMLDEYNIDVPRLYHDGEVKMGEYVQIEDYTDLSRFMQVIDYEVDSLLDILEDYPVEQDLNEILNNVEDEDLEYIIKRLPTKYISMILKNTETKNAKDAVYELKKNINNKFTNAIMKSYADYLDVEYSDKKDKNQTRFDFIDAADDAPEISESYGFYLNRLEFAQLIADYLNEFPWSPPSHTLSFKCEKQSEHNVIEPEDFDSGISIEIMVDDLVSAIEAKQDGGDDYYDYTEVDIYNVEADGWISNNYDSNMDRFDYVKEQIPYFKKHDIDDITDLKDHVPDVLTTLSKPDFDEITRSVVHHLDIALNEDKDPLLKALNILREMGY